MITRILLLGLVFIGISAFLVAAEPVAASLEMKLILEPPKEFAFDLESSFRLTVREKAFSLSNLTVLNLSVLEFQALTLNLSIGTIELENTLIFAPNIVEVDDDPFRTIVAVNPDPGDIVGVKTRNLLDDFVGSLMLAELLKPTIEGPAAFRKALLNLNLPLSQLKVSIAAFAANLGSVEETEIQTGMIFNIFGQEKDIKFSASAYIGAEGGFECFGRCRAHERILWGRVVPGLGLEEGKVQLEDINIAGVINDIKIGIDFAGPVQGIEEIAIDSSFSAPFGLLTVNNSAILNGQLKIKYNTTSVSLTIGNAILIARLRNMTPGKFDLFLQDFMLFFYSEEISIMELTRLAEYGQLGYSLLIISASLGNITFRSETLLQPPAKEGPDLFLRQTIILGISLGDLKLQSSTAFNLQGLLAQQFAVSISF
jgi:hypothetical protein